tara:strand:- start:632 stop:1057 length:426 start_codon:yes stop_codon:yes gene_type:complete
LKHKTDKAVPIFKWMIQVIIDTNMLLLPGQFHIDIFSQMEEVMDLPFELVYIDGTERELMKLAESGSQKDRMAAKLGLILLKQKSLKSMSSSAGESVDDAIVRLCGPKIGVATLDKELKKRVKAKKAMIITLKQKKYLIRE